jgi:tetratricopeptide (TPR) repeat protein
MAVDPHNKSLRKGLVTIYNRLGDLEWTMGDGAAALNFVAQAVRESHLLAAADPGNPTAQMLAIIVDADYGHKLFVIRGDVAAALDGMRSAAARLETLLRAAPENHAVTRSLGVLHYRIAEVWLYKHEYMQALTAAQNARRVLKAVLTAVPEDADLRVQEAAAEHDVAAALIGLGQLQEAARLEQTALGIVQTLAASDPKVAEYHGFVSMGLTRLGDIAQRQGQTERAIALLREGLQVSDAALEAGTMHPYIRHEHAQAAALLAFAYAMRATDLHRSRTQQMQDWQNAREWYGQALTSFRAISSTWFEAIEEAKHAGGEVERCERMLAGNTEHANQAAAGGAPGSVSLLPAGWSG